MRLYSPPPGGGRAAVIKSRESNKLQVNIYFTALSIEAQHVHANLKSIIPGELETRTARKCQSSLEDNMTLSACHATWRKMIK